MDYKEKSIMTDLLVQNQALRNAANGFKARCEELEAKNKRLEEARENANEACAKWEGLYRAELEKKSAWVSVKDRLPELINGKYAESVLVTDGEFRHIAYHYGKWFFCDSGQMKEPMFYKVTHWMPLPEPPKKE